MADYDNGRGLLIIIVIIIIFLLILALVWLWTCCPHKKSSTPPPPSNLITSLPFTASQSGTLIVDSALTWSAASGPAIIVNNSSDVNISFTSRGKITLTGVGPDYNLEDANQTYNNLLSGIYVGNGSNLFVFNANISNTAAAVNNSIGVILENVSNGGVSSSTFSNLTAGVIVVKSNLISVNSNNATDFIGNFASNSLKKGTGVAVNTSSDIRVTNNKLIASYDYQNGSQTSTGIYIGGLGNSRINLSFNTIDNVNNGIRVGRGDSFTINDNYIKNIYTDKSAVAFSIGIQPGQLGFLINQLTMENNDVHSVGFFSIPIFLSLTHNGIVRGNKCVAENSNVSTSQFGSANNGHLDGITIEDNVFTSIDPVAGMDGLDIESPSSTSGLVQTRGIRFVNNNISVQLEEVDGYIPPGLLAESVNDSEYSGNTISVKTNGADTYGVWLFGSSGISVRNNTIVGATIGVSANNFQEQEEGNSGLEIEDNFIKGGGVEFIDTSCSFIRNNRITSACNSITLDCSSDRNNVDKNDITCAKDIVNNGQFNEICDNKVNVDCGYCDSQNAMISKNRKVVVKSTRRSISKQDRSKRLFSVMAM